jgi:signal transduction histidine kinase
VSAEILTPGSGLDHRILIVAPMGADAHNLAGVLASHGLEAAACPNLPGLVREVESGCGAVLLTEEALQQGDDHLAMALARQPPWSDLPVILIVTGGNARAGEAARIIGTQNNVTMVERPLHTAILVSTVQAALRARRRQYEVRHLLAERDELLASLERRVAERTAKLEELNGELEAFSYSVSHDLRAPLRSLEMYARILCDDFRDALPEEARRFAERIAKNAEKMDRLTQDVLALSRLTRSEIRLEVLNLDVVLADLIEQYPDLAAARGRIEVCAPLGRVLGHGPSLTQCVTNLLQNALKFVPAGREPRVRVFSERRDGRLRLSIQDNGVGIDPTHHKRIFGIFERAAPVAVPGTGIGLAIAKKAVERMGGTIGVDSSPGAGARFWIELAAIAQAADECVAEPTDWRREHHVAAIETVGHLPP